TFIVILVTLVLQGLTLPWLIKKLNLKDKYSIIPEQEQEIIIQKKLAQYSLQFLEEQYGKDLNHNAQLNNLKNRFGIDVSILSRELEEPESRGNITKGFQKAYLEVLEHQRKILSSMNHKAEFDEDLIRKYLSLVDIEEYKLREKILVD